MAADPWTQAQKQAITTTGSSLLVAAAAGSGKTSVLAERCCYLVAEAPRRCSVEQLLVVTFAEEAAGEMKHRIEQRLTQRYLQAVASGEAQVAHLKHQAALASAAHISTLHSFCARLIRQNFHLAGLDPAFRVMDDQDCSLLRQEVAERLMEECFDAKERQGKGAGPLYELLEYYSGGDDDNLAARIIRIYETLRGIPDPQGWREMAVGNLREVSQGKRLDDSQLGR